MIPTAEDKSFCGLLRIREKAFPSARGLRIRFGLGEQPHIIYKCKCQEKC